MIEEEKGILEELRELGRERGEGVNRWRRKKGGKERKYN